jgi:ABC-2 type transport system ATP-binding protein
LIQAFVHDPELVILDEPTLGLDPMIQKELRAMLLEFQNAGKTVILSSHVLSEVETVCSNIGLINQGRIIKTGTLQELRGKRIHKISALLAHPEESIHSLEINLSAFGAYAFEIEKGQLRFEISDGIDLVLKELAKHSILELESRELSLEEVFFSEIETQV